MRLDLKTPELIGLVALATGLFCGLILIHQLGNTAKSLITRRNDYREIDQNVSCIALHLAMTYDDGHILI